MGGVLLGIVGYVIQVSMRIVLFGFDTAIS